MIKEVDYLIVGLGLAGSLLAKTLTERGFSIAVIDQDKPNVASRVAIGLVNPITGKRLVKSWLIDELIPAARTCYAELEQEFEMQFLHDCQVARVIPNQDIFEQWQPNFKQAVAEGYILPTVEQISLNGADQQYFVIDKCFWVDAKLLVEKMQEKLLAEEKLLLDNFKYNELKINENSLDYQNIRAKKVIFCEGYQAIHNPYFNNLPFNLNKGEVVKATINNYPIKEVLKKNIFILPYGTEYRIGATYNRENIDEETSPKAIEYFENKLAEIGLTAEFYEQRAAVRPATRDRRPFIGAHQTYQNVMIFNGFGAKGISLIPYFAQKIADELSGGAQIVREASTRRFFG